MTNSLICHVAPDKGFISSPSINDKLLNVSSQIIREKFVRLGTYKTNAQTPTKPYNKKTSNNKPLNKQKRFLNNLIELKHTSEGFGIGTYEYEICSQFITYLRDKSTSHIIANGITEEGSPYEHDFGYPHRYTEKYVKGRFAKMYKLDEWYQENKHLKMTFLTLTCHHEIGSMPDLGIGLLANKINVVFRRLQEGKRLLFREMLRRHPGMQYIAVTEPHESGIPHTHIIIFESFSIDEQIEYRNMWEAWNMGSFEHGLDFDERKEYKIGNIRNYLLSYMLKSLPGYKSKFKDVKPWTKEEILFNAIARKYGFRTWNTSRKLTQIMKYRYESGDSIEWTNTILRTDIDEFELWNKNNIKEDETMTNEPELRKLKQKFRDIKPTEPDKFSELWLLSAKSMHGITDYPDKMTFEPARTKQKQDYEQLRII